MKRPNQDSHELIEDIFAPEQASSALSAEEVLRLVQLASETRQRRRRFSITAAVFLAVAVFSVMFAPSRSRDALRTTKNIPAPSEPIANEMVVTHSVDPPTVEHVDDERMLSLLDETPAALVSWPDGRRSLLVLVANRPPK